MSTNVYEPMGGCNVSDAAETIVFRANETDEPWEMHFNDILLVAQPGDDAGRIVAQYHEELERRHQAWLVSPERAKQERAYKEKAAREAAELQAALAMAPEKMALRDEAAWQHQVELNRDGGYGRAVIEFAETWARIMEARIAAGEALDDIAEAASYLAASSIRRCLPSTLKGGRP